MSILTCWTFLPHLYHKYEKSNFKWSILNCFFSFLILNSKDKKSQVGSSLNEVLSRCQTRMSLSTFTIPFLLIISGSRYYRGLESDQKGGQKISPRTAKSWSRICYAQKCQLEFAVLTAQGKYRWKSHQLKKLGETAGSSVYFFHSKFKI